MLSLGGLVGGWDGDTRQLVVVGWDAGPAGLATLDLGEGITLDLDFASPARLSAMTVDGPLRAGPPKLADRARSTLLAVIGPSVVEALVERAERPGKGAIGRLDVLGSKPRWRGPLVPALGPLGRLAVLRALAQHPDCTERARLVAALEGAALAATGADRLGLPALRAQARADAERAAAWLPDLRAELLDAAAELDAVRPASWADRFDQRGRHRSKPQPGVLELAAAARRAAGLLTPALAARLLDLAASLERAGGAQGDDGDDGDEDGRDGDEDGRAADSPRVAGPPGQAAAKGRRAAQGAEAEAFDAALSPVAAAAAAGPARAADVPDPDFLRVGQPVHAGPGLRAVITGPTEMEVHGPAGEPAGRWVRAVRADGVLLALGPVDERGVARVLLPPGLGLGAVHLDVTAEPWVPSPSSAVALVREAVAAGRAACAAERSGEGAAASDAWVDCAQRWDDLGEPGRAHLAGAFADGLDPTGGPGTGRRGVQLRQPERPFLLDRLSSNRGTPRS